jgi:succinate-acetate transporter protein
MSDGQLRGNPAVVGLAGFAVTTGVTNLLLQVQILGWCGRGVAFCMFFADALAVHLVLTLVAGFIALGRVFPIGMSSLLTIATIDLIVCASLALHKIGHVVFLPVSGRDFLPVGLPLASQP